MKTFISLPLICVLVFLSFIPATAFVNNSDTYILSLRKQPTQNGDREWDIDREGNRAPSIPIECIIDKNTGIIIPDYIEEFVTYEIWDIEGINCISICMDEFEFINILFSISGNYQIRFSSTNYMYIGYLYL